MHGYRYEEPSAGFFRLPGAAVLAASLGGGAFLGGRTGGSIACDGMCELLAPVADLAQGSLPGTGDALSWGWAGVAGAGLALLIALTSSPRRKVTAVVSLIALALFGLVLLGGRAGEVAGSALREAGLATPPVLQALRPEARLATTCPEGSYARGEGCLSCRVETLGPEPGAVTLSPLRFTAAWGYAEDAAYALYESEAFAAPQLGVPLRNLTFDGQVAGLGASLCYADAALVLGSASSDGPRARNDARARRRAAQLAGQVRRACPGLPVYAASLGQSSASTDDAADRAITVVGVSARDGGAVGTAEIERELGHLLAEGGAGAPLLGRLRHFPGAWTWIEGGQGRFRPDAAPRAEARSLRLRDDAPESCRRQV